jgi:ssDNA-binding Zn-finger/Zn-ribbon topoisomerase 1
MNRVACPACGEEIAIRRLEAGARIDCPNCANLTFELMEKSGKLLMAEVPKVSCPVCDQILEVPGTLRAGDKMMCCGRQFQLTYEFGAYALS